MELHKTRVPEQILIPEWLGRQFGSDGIIAVDGLCTGADFVFPALFSAFGFPVDGLASAFFTDERR